MKKLRCRSIRCNFPKLLQLVSSRAGVQTQVSNSKLLGKDNDDDFDDNDDDDDDDDDNGENRLSFYFRSGLFSRLH